jgi:hypothetical protein
MTGLCDPFLSKGSVNTPTTIGYFLKRLFLLGPCKVVIKKSSAENNQLSSGVLSEQLVESWALQGRLRR